MVVLKMPTENQSYVLWSTIKSSKPVSNPRRKAPREENTVQSKLVRAFTIATPMLKRCVDFCFFLKFRNNFNDNKDLKTTSLVRGFMIRAYDFIDDSAGHHVHVSRARAESWGLCLSSPQLRGQKFRIASLTLQLFPREFLRRARLFEYPIVVDVRSRFDIPLPLLSPSLLPLAYFYPIFSRLAKPARICAYCTLFFNSC